MPMICDWLLCALFTKGAAVVRMLRHVLGEDTFMRGIQVIHFLGIDIVFSSLTLHCIFSCVGVRSVMPYYNKMID